MWTIAITISVSIAGKNQSALKPGCSADMTRGPYQAPYTRMCLHTLLQLYFSVSTLQAGSGHGIPGFVSLATLRVLIPDKPGGFDWLRELDPI